MAQRIIHDRYGPEYVVEVYDPQIGMRGFLVIDNTALGVGKGGIRMTQDVSKEEVARLARTMTWKNALAGIPFGGAKAGIVWPSFAKASEGKQTGEEKLKKLFIQSFSRAIAPFTPKKYIAGPDVNTGEREMQWFVEATGNWRSATGKPANLCMDIFGKKGEKCGIPHEFGSTGFGVAQAAKLAAELKGIKIKDATVAIEGFGNVGTFAFQFLEKMGAKIVAVADSRGTAFRASGLNFKEAMATKAKKGTISAYPRAKKLSHDAIFGLRVDILIPASVTDVINRKNYRKIRAKIIVEAANIPMKEEIEEALHKRGVLIVPDFVANAGGVISSYAEYRGLNPKRMFDLVERKITQTTKAVLSKSLATGQNPRKVAFSFARRLVNSAMNKNKA